MALINASNPSLLDLTQHMDPDGNPAHIIEALSRQNSLLEDMTFIEGNRPTGHEYTRRTALPDVAWRKINEGVTPSKDRTSQVTETCGILAGMSKVDRKLVQLNGGAGYRAAQDSGFLQSMRNKLEYSLFYESQQTNPERITGLAPRYNALSGETAGQVISSTAGGTPLGADQCSMFLVVWGPDKVFGVIPKGLPGGMDYVDMGLQLTKDSSGTKEYLAFVSTWDWNVGLCVADTRYVARLANIDTTNLQKTGNLLFQDMVTLVNSVQDLEGRAVIYCNRLIQTYLQQQAIDSTKQSTLTYDNMGGKRVTSFMGIPIRRTDALNAAEAIVT